MSTDDVLGIFSPPTASENAAALPSATSTNTNPVLGRALADRRRWKSIRQQRQEQPILPVADHQPRQLCPQDLKTGQVFPIE